MADFKWLINEFAEFFPLQKANCSGFWTQCLEGSQHTKSSRVVWVLLTDTLCPCENTRTDLELSSFALRWPELSFRRGWVLSLPQCWKRLLYMGCNCSWNSGSHWGQAPCGYNEDINKALHSFGLKAPNCLLKDCQRRRMPWKINILYLFLNK